MERPSLHGKNGTGQNLSGQNGAGPHLSWIDDYMAAMRRHLFVREADRILILMPNKAYKLNDQGIKILTFLMKGRSVREILDGCADRERVSRELHQFFTDLRMVLSDRLCDKYCSDTLVRVPFALGYNKLPVLSEIAVTKSCNIQCRFCYGDCGVSTEPAPSDLSYGQLTTLLRKIIEEAQVPSVSLTGGEPLIRDDLERLVRFATRIGLRVNLITNGTLATAKRARSLVKNGLRSVQISIEGTNETVHDAITKKLGSFERTKAAVGFFLDTGIPTHIHTTINRLNMEDMVHMPKFARELGLKRFSMNLLIPVGRGGQDDLIVRYGEVEPILLRVMERSREAGVEMMWYSPVPMCMFNPILHGLGNKGCAACDGLLSIDSEGRILPCSSYPLPLGNLLHESFHDIWDRKETRAIREKKLAPEVCHACEHFHVCTGACPLYWNHLGTAELTTRMGDKLKGTAPGSGPVAVTTENGRIRSASA